MIKPYLVDESYRKPFYIRRLKNIKTLKYILILCYYLYDRIQFRHIVLGDKFKKKKQYYKCIIFL